VRWDRDAGRWFAFVVLACAVVCFNRPQPVEGSEMASKQQVRRGSGQPRG
jgi:hypothetical protein